MLTTTKYKGIAIHPGDQSFPGFGRSVEDDLDRINETPTGRILLTKIGAGNPRVTSAPVGLPVSFRQGVNVVIMPRRSHYVQSGYRMVNVAGAGGLDQVIEPSNLPQYNPEGKRFYAKVGVLTVAANRDAAQNGTGSVAVVCYSNAAMPITGGRVAPSFIVLAHELIHASNDVYGCQMDNNPDEEQRVVGIGRWGAKPMMPLICENRIRNEAGLPARTSYP